MVLNETFTRVYSEIKNSVILIHRDLSITHFLVILRKNLIESEAIFQCFPKTGVMLRSHFMTH